jgi:hypothetical protein
VSRTNKTFARATKTHEDISFTHDSWITEEHAPTLADMRERRRDGHDDA